MRCTCPCMFMITTVLVRLQTTKCSWFLGSKWILLTAMSAAPRDLNVLMHSVDLMLHTFTVPSLLALQQQIKSFQLCQIDFMYVKEDRLYVYVKEERLLFINDKNTQNKSLLISLEIYQSLYKLCKKPTWECCVHLHWILLHLQRSCGPWTPSVFYQTSTHVFCKISTKILKQNIKPIIILI